VKVGLVISAVGESSSSIKTPWGRLVFSSVAQLADGAFLALEGERRTTKVKLLSVD